MLNLAEAIVAGILQGVLEWLPISSRGQVIVFLVSLVGMSPVEVFSLSVYLHIGTGFAGLIYFRKEFWDILNRKGEEETRLFNFLFLATIVSGLVAAPIFIMLELSTFVGESVLALTGAALIVTGLIQRRAGTGKANRRALGILDGLYMGVAQGLSAVPGLSRSGMTSSFLLLRGVEGERALRVSFLMSVPFSFAASVGLYLFEGAEAFTSTTIISITLAFVAGLFSIHLLLGIVKRLPFWKICLLIGGLIIGAYFTGLAL